MLKREFFSAFEGGMEIFGVNLQRISDYSWVLNHLAEIPNPHYAAQLEHLVQTRVDVDSEHNYILVEPKVFASLYIEGRISYEQLETAFEDVNLRTVTVEGVKLAKNSFIVKTMPLTTMYLRYQEHPTYVLVDARGRIIR